MNPFIEAQKRNGQIMQTQAQTGTMTPAQTSQNLMANPMNLINEFNRFRQSFTGDPKATVEQMLSSGQISQEQYNNAVMMANQMKGLFGMR